MVGNAPAVITLVVTQADIDAANESRRNSHPLSRTVSLCPLTQSCKRRKLHVGVGVTGYINTYGHVYWASHRAIKFMTDYDNHRPVKPGRFYFRRG